MGNKNFLRIQKKSKRIAKNDKIKCGRKHFEEIGVDYDVTTDIRNSRI